MIVVAGVVGAGTLLFEAMIGEDLVILIGSTSDPEDVASSRESNDDRRDLYVMRGFRIARRRGVGLTRACAEPSSSGEAGAEREKVIVSLPTAVSRASGGSSLSSGDPSPSSDPRSFSSSCCFCCCCCVDFPFRGVGAVFLAAPLLAALGVDGKAGFFLGRPGPRFTGTSETAIVSWMSGLREGRVRDLGEAMRARFEEGACSESGVLRLGGIIRGGEGVVGGGFRGR